MAMSSAPAVQRLYDVCKKVFTSTSVSAGPCGRAMLGDCGFNARAGELNSTPAWVRKTWNGHGVGVGVGVVCGGALGAYGRGSAGRGPPAHVHARDRVVDFGKNKGSMLGTLSSG